MQETGESRTVKDFLPSFPHEEDTPYQILVHLTAQEMKLLDKIQGRIFFDKKTGVKSYGHLWTLLKKNPQLIRRLFEDSKRTGSHYLGDILENFLQKVPVDVQSYGTEGMVAETEAQDVLEKQGRGGDTKIAFFPIGLAKLFIALQGGVKRNPQTGLLEFGLFDEIVRIAGTVGGFLVGGPAGAGIGNALASVATGKSLKDSAVSGLKNWGLSSVANMGLNALGNAGSTAGSAQAGQLGSNAAQQATGQATSSATHVSNQAINKPSLSSFVEKIPVPMKEGWELVKAGAGMVKDVAPIAIPSLMMLGARKERAEAEKRYQEEMARRNTYNAFSPTEQMNRDSEEIFKQARGYKKGGAVYTNPSSLNGGLFDGPGTGQSDSIKSKAPQHSYIIDASTVSDLGDGSSEAGGEKLKQFERFLEKKYKITTSQKKQRWPLVDVAVARDEYQFTPFSVMALGGGSVKKGEGRLRRFVDNVRKHKRTKADQLPPKAKSIRDYLNVR